MTPLMQRFDGKMIFSSRRNGSVACAGPLPESPHIPTANWRWFLCVKLKAAQPPPIVQFPLNIK